MTSFQERCQSFGDTVDDIQACTDADQLRHLMTTGLTQLLVVRNMGFKLFDVTEQCKLDAETARKAFDEKTLVLQNMLYENGYYQNEINEARNYMSSVSDSEMELISTDQFFQTASTDFYSDLDKSATDYEHQLLLRRLEHEQHSRKQARQQLNELKARRDAMHASLGLKRKAVDDLSEHVTQIKAASAPVRKLISQSDTGIAEQQQLAQLLPLPLYMIFSQTTAILQLLTASVQLEVTGSAETAQEELSAAVKSAAPAGNKRQKREGSPEPGTDTDVQKVFPLSVQLHLKDAELSLSFSYLPTLGIVTVEAGTMAANALLATLFQRDTGKETPSDANHYMDEGTYVFDPEAKARPYRWAQWLAGLDFLPTLPAGLALHGQSHHNAVQQGLNQYRRQKRALHVLRALVQRSDQAQLLQAELAELLSKHIPLSFPNRLFPQLPGGSISMQEVTRHVAEALPQAAQAALAADEDEEGEVQEAEPTEDAQESEDAAQSMQVDTVLKEEEVEAEASANVPVPLVAATDGQVTLDGTSGAQQDLEAGQRFFKLHLKSSTGWQLDGQVRIQPLYPAAPPQILITNAKEVFRPSLTQSKRQELPTKQVMAMQTQVQKFPAELDKEEKQQTLSYQLASLLHALNEQTASKKLVNAPPSRATSRPASATAELNQHHAATFRGSRAPAR